MYGEGAVTDQMYQKWFAKFRAGDFSLDSAPQSSRPVEADRDQIETLTENDQRYNVGDSWYTHKTQINKVIGENEKCDSHFMEKKYELFDQPSIY